MQYLSTVLFLQALRRTLVKMHYRLIEMPKSKLLMSLGRKGLLNGASNLTIVIEIHGRPIV